MMVEHLARLAGAWLDPEGLREPRRVLTRWYVRMIPWCNGEEEEKPATGKLVRGWCKGPGRGNQTKQE